jgi:uncharacterized protein YacL
MDLLFLILGLSNTIVYFYKEEWLFDKTKFIFYFYYTIILFFISILLNETYFNSKFVKFLMLPFFNILIFIFLFFIFKRLYKRNPQNTFWSYSKKPIQDVLFTIIYWIVGFLIPIILIFKICK